MPVPATSEARRLFALQQDSRWRVARSSATERRQRLARLRASIERHREAVYAAMHADFRKHRVEVELTEVQPTLIELEDARSHVGRWMQPVRARTPLVLSGARSELVYEARGVVLILAPWNYPFQLLLSPLIAAVAAGNCAIVRPSEKVPHTSRVLAQIIRDAFDESEVACITEDGIETASELVTLPFDHIFFTGSTAIGRRVMEAAAANLASVTLELGGKSPLVVDESADVAQAATRAMWGKFVNAGQTCVAPDYALVHERVLPAFVEASRAAVASMYGATEELRRSSADFPRMIDAAAFARVAQALDAAVAAGARVEFGGATDAAERYIAPTLLTGVPPGAALMTDEIFGPVLPVVSYTRGEEAAQHINRLGKPLALYVFSRDARATETLLRTTSSGGAVVNNVLIHLGNPNLPFGGVGESGQGSYHGRYGFRTFSHERSVMRQGRGATLGMLYPPYTSRKERMLQLIGRILT
jgi:aldehyde dehydrogenase (NAD+)